MSNQPTKSLARAVPIDPEFAEVYAQAGGMPGQPDSYSASDNRSGSPKPQSGQAATTHGGSPDPFRGFEEFAELALKQQQTAIDRKTLPAGSFDQIENDLSNCFRLGFDFLTRT